MSSSFKFMLALASVFSTGALADPTPLKPVNPLNKIVWVWLENTPYASMITQKYVKSLVATYPSVTFSNYLPSSPVTQADAFTLITGSDLGAKDNSVTRILNPTLVDLPEAQNIPWKIYAEDFPGSCYLGAGTGAYARYRVPFISISRVESDRYECMKVVGLNNFKDDVNYNLVPRFSVVIPNLLNGGVGNTPASVDANLKTLLAPVLLSPTFTNDTTVIISTINNVWTTSGTAPVFTLAFGAGIQTGNTVVSTAYSHANLLRTLESALSLGNLGNADATSTPMLGFWK